MLYNSCKHINNRNTDGLQSIVTELKLLSRAVDDFVGWQFGFHDSSR